MNRDAALLSICTSLTAVHILLHPLLYNFFSHIDFILTLSVATVFVFQTLGKSGYAGFEHYPLKKWQPLILIVKTEREKDERK